VDSKQDACPQEEMERTIEKEETANVTWYNLSTANKEGDFPGSLGRSHSARGPPPVDSRSRQVTLEEKTAKPKKVRLKMLGW